ncbi:MAG TPA: hypothetical protein VL752_17710, partial [Acidisoma sp.]|nr:hypothetical protein [Acidisoma sp.]
MAVIRARVISAGIGAASFYGGGETERVPDVAQRPWGWFFPFCGRDEPMSHDRSLPHHNGSRPPEKRYRLLITFLVIAIHRCRPSEKGHLKCLNWAFVRSICFDLP